MELIETRSRDGSRAVVEVVGRLDGAHSAVFDARLAGILGRGRNVIVDCSRLDYISSAGLRSLLLAAKAAKAAGARISLAALQKNVREGFELSGFSSVFVVHATRAEAEAAS